MANKRIYLWLAHMNEAGFELKYIQDAFDTNWVVWLNTKESWKEWSALVLWK